jgi:hypothetical protein
MLDASDARKSVACSESERFITRMNGTNLRELEALTTFLVSFPDDAVGPRFLLQDDRELRVDAR